MLKIYLDWNCITHSKDGDSYSFIQDIVKKYGDHFIFPYSNAHIRDLMVSHNPSNNFYDQDIEALTKICGKHHLVYEEECIQPKFVMPKEYINTVGSTIESIQKAELLPAVMYKAAKDSVQFSIPNNVLKRIQGAKPTEAINIINKYLVSKSPTLNLSKLMTQLILRLSKFINAELNFKLLFLGLDMFGYNQDKANKKFTNIDTDASHAFYASFCDYFVTRDTHLKNKATALYSEYNTQTKIISPLDLKVLIEDELSKEYDIKYMVSCIDKYGIPEIKKDGAHYKLMKTPVFGIFNFCVKINDYWKYEGDTQCGLFRYCFQNVPYLYYTELEHFFELFAALFLPSNRDRYHEEYVKPMLSGDKDKVLKAQISLECTDFDMIINLSSDPESFIPCPMMQVIIGSEALNQLKHTID